MIVTSFVDSVRQNVGTRRQAGSKIAFVPTMGALHEGHLSLIEFARSYAGSVVVSIFVNPTQFNNESDLACYPRTLQEDKKKLEEAGVDLLFVPEVSEIYTEGSETFVDLEHLALVFEGAQRPGHFRGVATVVATLFNIVSPDFAVFGEKDFQQVSLIERMVKDLKFPIEILRAPLVREEDGLAYSSRNARLGAEGRASAPLLFHSLQAISRVFEHGERKADSLLKVGREILSEDELIALEYLDLVDEVSLEPIETAEAGSRLLLAAWIDGIRLIDNLRLGNSMMTCSSKDEGRYAAERL